MKIRDVVQGTKGPLQEGELARAADWAKEGALAVLESPPRTDI